MATVEVKEPEVIDAEFVDNIAPERRFAQEVQNRGIPPVALESINPELLYQTAEQYEIAAQKMAQMRDGFAGQALDVEQQRADLERLYAKSAKPLGATETTAAILAGAVVAPKAVELISKHVYNPETIAKQGLDAAVDAMGKKTNLNPLNWFSNLVNGSHTVKAMQDNVEAAVQNISGDNLANAITLYTDDMIQAAGIDGQTQEAFKVLDKSLDKISSFKNNRNWLRNVDNVDNNVRKVYDNVTDAMKVGVGEAINELNTPPPYATKEKIVEIVTLNYDAAKDAAIQSVEGTAEVHGHLLGNAKEIKEAITAKAGGIESLAEKAKKDLHGNKIAEGMIWARDKFQNADPKVKTAIVVTTAVLGATLAYLGIEHVNNERKKNLNHIDEQIVATEEKKEDWIKRVGSTENNRIEAIKASSKIREIADWKTKLEREEVSVGGKGF
jgi:hypothetical protein